VRIGRDYGNPGDYDTQFVGLNGRLSEMHAAVALASFEHFADQQKHRDEIAGRYRDALAGVPGVRVQVIDAGDTSTYKDFTIAVDAAFGTDRDTLRRALTAEGVDTRCYFDPPVHRQTAYASLPQVALPSTDRVAGRVLSLPIYPALTLAAVDRIAAVIAEVHAAAADL
jgi:dTDP-4-amino-4,6-dideoxygalactose transaminase